MIRNKLLQLYWYPASNGNTPSRNQSVMLVHAEVDTGSRITKGEKDKKEKDETRADRDSKQETSPTRLGGRIKDHLKSTSQQEAQMDGDRGG